jgi:starch synthase
MWGGARRLGLRRVYDATVGRETLAAADAVVCVSRPESELLLAEVGCDPAKIRVIPNGIHWETWADPPTGARFRKTFPQLGERLVLYAGRLATNKGLPDLVTAAASFPEAELLLVGQDMGPGEALDAQAAAAGITLHRLGHLDDDLYRSAFGAAELLALPSDYEAFGIVLLEAAAAGLPVVATRVGGVPEAVAEGETGLLVDYGDPEALGAAIASLLSDADAAAALGASGRERVARDFTWVSIVGRIEALYAELR